MIKKYDVFLVVLLIGSLSLNVYLGWTVKRLRRTPANPQNSVNLSPMIAPPITALNQDGEQETITYVGKPTVVYVFSPQCRWCVRNTQSINALASLKGDSFKFVGLSLSDDNLAKYLESDSLSFPVYKNPSPDAVRSLGLSSTPQTIVISADGRVLKTWGSGKDAN